VSDHTILLVEELDLNEAASRDGAWS